MGKPNTLSLPFSTTNEYTEWRPSDTEDIKAVRNMADRPETLAPAQQAQYDRARERNDNRFGSAYNTNLPTAARLAMQSEADRDLTADYGTAQNQAAYDAYGANLSRRLALANLTTGRPLQSKSYGYGTQPRQSSGVAAAGISGGATVAAAALV